MFGLGIAGVQFGLIRRQGREAKNYSSLYELKDKEINEE